ncbi:MAG TPA: YeeE/YedE family protein [Burkholderiales bacterium]|nr:YeeE/YedE family protein [Burkholderiales bacterium]
MSMVNFTPVSALIGGALIGISASLLLWLTGRVAGVSGIMHGALLQRRDTWRWLFLAGLIAGAGGWLWLAPPAFAPRAGYPVPLVLLSGMLVGFGTAQGGGCTSGHGVCGISRLSGRSIAATLTFMLTGMIGVFVVRHLFGVAS